VGESGEWAPVAVFAGVQAVSNVRVEILERAPESVEAAEVFAFLDLPGVAFTIKAIESLAPGPTLDLATNRLASGAVAALLFTIGVTPCKN
jgi:hypothetical protein